METVKQRFGPQLGGMKQTQVLLDWEKMQRTGQIILKPSKVVTHKEKSFSFRSFRAKVTTYGATNVTCGIPLEAYDNGTYKFMSITVGERTVYNLHDEMDAMKWFCLQHFNEVEGSPNLIGDPLWLIHNEEKIAEKGLIKSKQIMTAWQYINNLSGNDLTGLGRLFNRNPANESESVIKYALLQLAEKSPEKILNAIANIDTLEITKVFYRAKSVGLIRQTVDRGITTEQGTVLGQTVAAAVETLRRDLQLLQILDQEGKAKDKTYISSKTDNVVENMYKKKLFNTTNQQPPEKITMEEPVLKEKKIVNTSRPVESELVAKKKSNKTEDNDDF